MIYLKSTLKVVKNDSRPNKSVQLNNIGYFEADRLLRNCYCDWK